MRKMDAYFTVEAALLFPFVMGVILLTIYLLFFEYDRCLMEQSAGVLAMRGCTLPSRDKKSLVTEVLLQSREEDKSYFAWDMGDPEIQAKGNFFTVSRTGTLRFPFRGLSFWRGEAGWESRASYQNLRIRPVFMIRQYKKAAETK